MEFKEVFQPIINFVKGLQKKENENSKMAAKERLKLVLMQDRASVSPDFFEMMKKEIIEVIKKYIEIDEEALEVQLTRGFEDGLEGPALYANIPIKNIKPVAKKIESETVTDEIKEVKEEKQEEVKKDEEKTNNYSEDEKIELSEEIIRSDVIDNEENANIDEIIEIEQEESKINNNVKVEKVEIKENKPTNSSNTKKTNTNKSKSKSGSKSKK